MLDEKPCKRCGDHARVQPRSFPEFGIVKGQRLCIGCLRMEQLCDCKKTVLN